MCYNEPVPIAVKRVYDPAAREDGFRLLGMRLWPRGIKREHVSAWEKELGPSSELFKGYRAGTIDWTTFARRYRAEIRKKPELLETWAKRGRKKTLTLLCSCEDPKRCHRTLLKKLLEEQDS